MSRYHRQSLLPGFGPQAQERLARAHAAIIGCGALGCTIADHLARAGVGMLTVVDRDIVEITNLHRQSLFTEADARDGIPKAEAAARRLRAVNSGAVIRAVTADLGSESAERLLGLSGPSRSAGAGPDSLAPPALLLDATDNFETRFLLNDLAVKHALPLLYAGAVGTRAMQATFLPGHTACLRCLFDPPAPGAHPTCETAGILAPVAAIAASLQAVDALKLLIGRPDLLSHTLIDFDPWNNTRRRIDLGPPRPGCPACDVRRFELLGAPAQPASLCGQNAIQVPGPAARANHPGGARLDLQAIRERLASHGDFALLGSLLLRGELTYEPSDRTAGAASPRIHLTLFPDGRAIFTGTTDAARARSLYARYIGL
jgi:molybdopterin/thiamine biosynthesis adenylyltransferase